MIRKKQKHKGPIVIDLTGPDGNAYALMAYAKRFATQLEWKDKGAALINEMMEGDYDVAGTRNNNDHGKAGMHPGITFWDIPMYGFLNAGLVASTKKEFWEEWNDINHKWDTEKSYGPTGGGENDSLNILKTLFPAGTEVSSFVCAISKNTTPTLPFKGLLTIKFQSL